VPPAASTWKRLGDLLVRRRIELDPAYANRQKFADAVRVNYRTIADIEKGRRDNYEAATIASVEVAYRLAGGSIARTVAGGSLEPLSVTERTVDPSAQAARARADTSDPDTAPDVLFPADPVRQDMWRVITDPRMPADEKLAALAGPALFPGDRAKQAIVAADIISREKPAEMAAKIRVLDRMRAEARGRSVHSEQSA
jgi:hypothetical protein